MTTIELDQSLTAKNDAIARENKARFDSAGAMCVNLMGAPGSGKTTLIEGLAPFVKGLLVIQGDLKSDVDMKRLEAAGVHTIQINTHSGCHLNADMIKRALEGIELNDVSLVIIENVGNLVCPAGVMLGQHLNVVVSATTEGSDKPEKYPLIFRDSDAIVISKMDIADAVEFDRTAYLKRLAAIGAKGKIFEVSKKDSKGYDLLNVFLESKRR